jgi:hypothetical protein
LCTVVGIATYRRRRGLPQRADEGHERPDFNVGQKRAGGHLGRNACFDQVTQRSLVRRARDVGAAQIRTAPAACVQAMAHSAIALERLPALIYFLLMRRYGGLPSVGLERIACALRQPAGKR